MEATTEVVNRHPDADLILLDLHMPGAHGFSGLIQLRGQMPDIPVAVVSGSDELRGASCHRLRCLWFYS